MVCWVAALAVSAGPPLAAPLLHSGLGRQCKQQLLQSSVLGSAQGLRTNSVHLLYRDVINIFLFVHTSLKQ